MKTLTFLLLIMSLVGYGQNNLQVLTVSGGIPGVKDIRTGKPYSPDVIVSGCKTTMNYNLPYDTLAFHRNGKTVKISTDCLMNFLKLLPQMNIMIKPDNYIIIDGKKVHIEGL